MSQKAQVWKIKGTCDRGNDRDENGDLIVEVTTLAEHR